MTKAARPARPAGSWSGPCRARRSRRSAARCSVHVAAGTTLSTWRIASSVRRSALGGSGSSGSSSLFTRPPVRANGHPAKLCATKRRTPTACPADSRWSVPSVRRRSVSAKSRSMWRKVNRRQRRQLMHDHVGLRPADRAPDRVRIERVDDDRARAQAAHQFGLRRRARHPHHLMPARDQLGTSCLPSARWRPPRRPSCHLPCDVPAITPQTKWRRRP
jgi:hypothetical protein